MLTLPLLGFGDDGLRMFLATLPALGSRREGRCGRYDATEELTRSRNYDDFTGVFHRSRLRLCFRDRVVSGRTLRIRRPDKVAIFWALGNSSGFIRARVRTSLLCRRHIILLAEHVIVGAGMSGSSSPRHSETPGVWHQSRRFP